MSKFIKIKGPKLKSILKFIEKKDFAMVKSGLRESSIFLKKDAQEMAPVVTGAFRSSIRRQVRGRIKLGQATATVGVALGTPAWKYAAKVEKKHKIFRILETTKPKPVRSIFVRAINEFWRKQRVKK